jgi:hypothetical protein
MNERLTFAPESFELDPEFDESSELFNDELEDGEFDLEADSFAELGDGEDSLESEFAEEAIDPANAMQPRSATPYGKEPLGAQTLWGMYESDELFNEGIVSFEYPLYHATEEEMDYFLGKLVRRVSRAARGDLFVGPRARPVRLVMSDPIVRPARQAPTADRRVEGNGGAIEDQRPVGRPQWGNDLVAAAAAALVHNAAVLHRYVKDALLEDVGRGVDKHVAQGNARFHGRSSLVSALPPMM